MSVTHDMQCSSCDAATPNAALSVDGTLCRTCRKGRMEIVWRSVNAHDAAVHPKERAVLYYSDKERKFQYPSRNDQTVPKRLEQRGYQRVEMTSLRDIQVHEKRTGTVSHVANYDRGSGRSIDGD